MEISFKIRWMSWKSSSQQNELFKPQQQEKTSPLLGIASLSLAMTCERRSTHCGSPTRGDITVRYGGGVAPSADVVAVRVLDKAFKSEL
mgnify:CR=1 FL=1